jgi:hypothetical protein
MHVMMRGDRSSIERGWLIMPPAKSGLDFLVNPVADGLNDFRVDNVTFRVDGDFNDHVAGEVVRKLGAVDGLGKDDGISDVHIVAKDWPIDEAAERRARFGVEIPSIGVGFNLAPFFRRLPFLRLPLWLNWRGFWSGRKCQFAFVSRAIFTCRRQIGDLIAVSGVSPGEPSWGELRSVLMMEHDDSESDQMKSDRRGKRSVAPEPIARPQRVRGLE